MTKQHFKPFSELPAKGELVCVQNGFHVYVIGHYYVVQRMRGPCWYTVRSDWMRRRFRPKPPTDQIYRSTPHD